MPKPKTSAVHNPDIEAWLLAQDEETELCLRMVLSRLPAYGANGPQRQARFRELQARLCKTENDVVRYLRKSKKLGETILRALSGQ